MNKHSVIIVSTILFCVIVICVVGLKFNSKVSKATLQENREFEEYLDDTIYGTDVITLINKAISNNEKNNVEKDDNENYIENSKNSIIIELVIITNEEKKETTSYRMERINKVGITEFINNFNTVEFKCTKKEYHKETGKISYIEITEQISY